MIMNMKLEKMKFNIQVATNLVLLLLFWVHFCFFRFSVVASDGWYNDTAQVLIQLININDWDPKFRYTDYSFYVGKVKN